MTTFHAVFRDGAIALPDDVHLEDVTRLEIRTVDAPSEPTADQTPEEWVRQQLIAAGLVTPDAVLPNSQILAHRKLIEVEGEPLSQQIIRERR